VIPPNLGDELLEPAPSIVIETGPSNASALVDDR
jgi:hypothetical protein